MKRFLSVLIVAAMLISMVPTVFADTGLSGTIEAIAGEVYETETWTAPADGVLTINVSSEEGAGYKVYCNDECLFLGYSLTHEESVSYDVVAGDTYYLEVVGRSPEAWSNCDATIHYSFDFVAGGVAKEDYIISEQIIIEEGTHTVTMEPNAEVTVVAFTPAETGYYTLTVPEGTMIANCGGGSWYIAPWDSVTPSTTIEWLCEEAGYWTETEVSYEETVTNPETDKKETVTKTETIEQYVEGQTLMLGIVSDSETVEVTVTKTGDYTKEEIELQEYVNKAELSQFTLPEGAVLGDYVNVYGDTHTAVLGDDGYYHLDSADGPVLLVDMDYLFRLSDVLKSDRPVMYAYVTDESGNIVEKWDIANAVLAYEAVCDENLCYPLTEDLIFFYSVYAKGNGVLDYVLGTGYNADCAWMYACLTMTLPGSETPEAEEGTEENPIIIDSLPYDFYADFKKDAQADAGIYYLYTAEKDGFIEIKDIFDDFNTGTLSVVTDDGWEMLTESLTGYEVKAGETILLCHWGLWAGEYDCTLQYKEETETPENPDGPENPDDPEEPEIPDEGEWIGENVEVAADETIVITYTPDADGVLSVEISCLTGWQVSVVDEFSEETVWSDTHTSADDPVSFELVAGTTYTITLIPYDQADGWTTCDAVMSYEITFTPAGEEPEVVLDGELTDGNNYMPLPADPGVVNYGYTATFTGTLYFAITYMGYDMGYGLSDNTDLMNTEFAYYTELLVDGNIPDGGYYGSIEVVEGETYVFTLSNIGQWGAEDWYWEAILNLSETDELLPKIGTENIPAELWFEDLPTTSIEIGAGETVYYQLYQFNGTVLTITGKDAYAIVTTIDWDMQTGMPVEKQQYYYAENGVVEVPISGMGAALIQIGNAGTTAATFGLDAYYPVGSEYNPDELKEGNNRVSLEEGNEGYYYTWTAPCDGTFHVTVGSENWMFYVHNTTSGYMTDWHSQFDDESTAAEWVSFSKGDVILVFVATIDENEAAPAGKINTYVAITYDHTYGKGVHHDAACEQDAYTEYTCSVCGQVHQEVEEGTALVHNYVDGKCTICGGFERMLGDVNGDDEVDTTDAYLIVQYYNELMDMTEEQLSAADVDNSGEVDTTDAYWIVQYYNELIDSLPGEG